MKVEEIERLLAKFYEGTTTESQEEALRDYFRTTEVPEHLLKDKEIFLNLYLNADHDVEIPAYLEDKLNLLIDEMAEKEQRFFRPNSSKNNWRWIGSIAATILLLVGLGYGIDNLGKNVCPPTPHHRRDRGREGCGRYLLLHQRHCRLERRFPAAQSGLARLLLLI